MSTEQRKQVEGRYHNSPEAGLLSPEERVYLDAARTAWGSIRKTFDLWVTVGRGVQALRDRADKIGGRQTFKRLLDQEGLGELDKATITRLLQIMDRHDEVAAWHKTLTDKQRLLWSSPSAVFKHCPVFKRPPSATGKSEPLPIDKARQIPSTLKSLLAAATECDYAELQAVYAECLRTVRECERVAKAFTPPVEAEPETVPRKPRKAAPPKPTESALWTPWIGQPDIDRPSSGKICIKPFFLRTPEEIEAKKAEGPAVKAWVEEQEAELAAALAAAESVNRSGRSRLRRAAR